MIRKLHCIYVPREAIDNKATGQKLRTARESAKISLREMAIRMDMSAPFLSDLELGRRGWSEDRAALFLEKLGKKK